MGLFSDKCEALIDLSTRRALQGEALTRARQDPKAARCGNRVPKAAKFCNQCGSPAPGGWKKCPSCGKWVGNEAIHCWNCQAPMRPDLQLMMSAGAWRREAGVFAQRLEVADIQKVVREGLTVEIGTVALLVEGGLFKGTLEPGQHTLHTWQRRFQDWVGAAPRQTVILVDNGDIVLPLRFSGLRTAEDLLVEAYTEVCFHFDQNGADRFLQNVLKGAEQLAYGALTDRLYQEMRGLVLGAAQATRIDDLVKDPGCRLAIENALRDGLATVLERCGLQLVRVASVEFTGADYESLRNQAGQLDVKRRELEFQQRMRELLGAEAMDQAHTEQELDEYVRQLAQEKGVSAELRDQEMARLKQVHRHELEKTEAAYQMAVEMEQAAHEIGVKLRWDDYTREKLLKDAEVQARLSEIKTVQEVREAQEWLRVRAEKKRLDLEAQKAQAEAYAGLEIKTLIALLPDNAQRQQLLELHRQSATAGQSVEQMLASAAAQSPEAAQALARMREVKREDLEREFQERKQLSDESVARLERVLAEAMKAIAEQARPHLPPPGR